MSEQHTLGQLLTAADSPNGKTSICTHTGTGWREVANAKTEADARRLVACWNACEGLSTESLESFGLILAVNAEIYRLRALRYELIDALKYIDGLANGDAATGGLSAISQVARAAIAKAEGGEA